MFKNIGKNIDNILMFLEINMMKDLEFSLKDFLPKVVSLMMNLA